MNNYLIPANTKKGQLIFSIFRPIDLAIFGVGLSITLILLAFFPTNDVILLIFTLLPGLIGIFLVIPLPNYHNMLILLIEIFNFLTNNQKYIWRGWCIGYGRNKKTR